MKPILILLLLISLISGCVDTKPGDVIYNGEVIPEYSPVVDIAKKDLAGRLNIPVEEILLVKQEKVDWSDTSLGFPEVGMMYAQVITPGFRVILKAEGKFYEYHSDYKRVVGPKEVSY
ncbi:MAG: hypothetical protein WC568_04410 [Candidatus Methanoperedens sp.]